MATVLLDYGFSKGLTLFFILSGTAPVHPLSLLLGPPSTQGSDPIQNQNTQVLLNFYTRFFLPGSQLLLEIGRGREENN